jgi:hypothetical protein
MADVRLDFYDLDAEALPDVCMKCGAPPVVRPMKTFSWIPYWARLVPFGYIIFMKRRRVPIPLCEQHKNHWTIRYLIGFGGLALFLFLFIGGGMVMAAASENDPGGPGVMLGGLMLAVGGVAFLAWLITMIVLGVTMINVFEITDDDITLKNVSLEFADAYRAQTRGGVVPDVDDMGRRGWARPAPGAADPRRPRRPDLPPDDKYSR